MKMKTKTTLRLPLHRETLRVLDLRKVTGGGLVVESTSCWRTENEACGSAIGNPTGCSVAGPNEQR